MAVLSDEQTMLKDAAREWTAAKSPTSAFRRLRDAAPETGFDKALWRDMAEMGWAGVLIPEIYGGSEFGHRALGVILEETGRTLTASPLLSTALIVPTVLIQGGSAAQKETWLPRLADGSAIGALALEERPHHSPEATAAPAVRSGQGWRLTGTKRFVLDAGAADVLIVVARTAGRPGDPAGLTLFITPADAPGVTRRALSAVDSRGVADIVFDGLTVSDEAIVGPEGAGFDLLEGVLDRARAGLAAEMLGAASQAFETTLDYLKTRTQFGQPIGSFQALQHRAAKMFTALEMTRSCVEAALDAIDGGSNDVRALCSLAKGKACETLHLVTNEMVQMHGGVGMTDAHDAGLYLKRARVSEALFGGAAFHRDRYARLMGF
jgi:alkylation response protein AidB-like acyl-CoA dehydrogenase